MSTRVFDRLHTFNELLGWKREPQGRGLEFERWISSCLREEKLSPRLSFKPVGEQIDGSFLLNHQFFLLEAKWKRDPVPASDIYAFKGKVDGKLVGTIGFFISMSGYSKDAVDAVRAGKTVNVLLIDDHDVLAAAQKSFVPILEYKLRAVAELGEIFSPFTAAVPAPRQTRREPVEEVRRTPVPDLSTMVTASTLAIVVEGPKDETVVTVLANRLLDEAELDRPFAVFAANGRYGLASLANGMSMQFPDADTTLIVGDAEEDAEDWRRTILQSVANPNTEVIIAEPGIEAWLGSSTSIGRLTIPDIWKAAQTVDLNTAVESNPSLQEFKKVLLSGATPVSLIHSPSIRSRPGSTMTPLPKSLRQLLRSIIQFRFPHIGSQVPLILLVMRCPTPASPTSVYAPRE